MAMEFYDDGEHAGSTIGCLTYQSRAATLPSEAELDALVAKARVRNHSVGVTGMLLYERGRFLQTLEGPTEGLDQIWNSIRRDDRHADIEVLTKHLVAARLFSDWDLLLYRKLEQTPQSLLEKLRRKHPLAQYLKQTVEWAVDAREQDLVDLFERLGVRGWAGGDIAKHLIEPAARALGDAWLADDCSEFDMTLGLSVLQTSSHALRFNKTSGDGAAFANRSILLAPAPGETHNLGPSMLADQFADAGWAVDIAFPASLDDLTRQVAEQQPDAIDLALSDALTRQDKVKRLRETIKQCRKAVPDKPLVVSVGGRLFAEALVTAEHVGADYARHSIDGAEAKLAELVGSPGAAPLFGQS